LIQDPLKSCTDHRTTLQRAIEAKVPSCSRKPQDREVDPPDQHRQGGAGRTARET
jgi:hypothetical protein